MNNNYITKIENATLADAKEWAASQEQTMWAMEYLKAFTLDKVSKVIDQLEEKLASLLAA